MAARPDGPFPACLWADEPRSGSTAFQAVLCAVGVEHGRVVNWRYIDGLRRPAGQPACPGNLERFGIVAPGRRLGPAMPVR
jgi:hypothetical protein